VISGIEIFNSVKPNRINRPGKPGIRSHGERLAAYLPVNDD
jgi:hypothetical protein